MFLPVNRIFPFILMLLLAGCNKGFTPKNQEAVQTHGIIPLPRVADFLPGSFIIDSSTVIISDSNFSSAKKVADNALNISLIRRVGNDSDTSGKSKISIITDSSLKDEGYELHISQGGIKLTVKTAKGAFYAARSLSQMIWQASPGKHAGAFGSGVGGRKGLDYIQNTSWYTSEIYDL